MEQLRIGNREIEYRARRGNSSKYVYLKLKPNLQLEIILPRDEKVRIEDVLRKKKALIERKYNELLNRKKVYDGNRLLYRGKYRNVKVLHARGSKNKVRIQGNDILVFSSKEEPMQILKKWVKRKTEQYLKRNLAKCAQNFGISLGKTSVKDTKRWGFCTKERNLVFNWQLISLPRELSEYVIIHELAHISEFNHSRNFQKRIAAFCPDFKEREKMLKNIIPIPK